MTSTAPLSVPGRHASNNGSSSSGGASARHHAHSVSLGTLNTSHRVTRRKSMTSNGLLSIAAAVQGIDSAALDALVAGGNLEVPVGGVNTTTRHRAGSTATASRPSTALAESYSAMNLNGNGSEDQKMEESGAMAEGMPTQERPGGAAIKGRHRRASEGQYLAGKGEAKNGHGELRCEKCGKGYKHSSCLTKHLSVFHALSRRDFTPLPVYFHHQCLVQSWDRQQTRRSVTAVS